MATEATVSAYYHLTHAQNPITIKVRADKYMDSLLTISEARGCDISIFATKSQLHMMLDAISEYLGHSITEEWDENIR